jgi:putative glutamine amidotransferase
MPRPVIGLSTYREPARWGAWSQSADLLPSQYAQAITLAGGIPLLLPPTEPHADAAATVVERVDGLVITGGADVDPARYDEPAHPATVKTRPDRDGWELALLDAAGARGIPTLGICRGMQVMAVHAGGHLDQHVPDLVEHDRHNPGADAYGETGIKVAKGSRLATLVGETGPASCHHHQSVRDHPGFTAVAWAEDGLLEAIEDPKHRFRLGVQWHPEVDADRGLFRGLVMAAAG